MTPEPGEPWEAEGVLNPAAGRTPDGRLHLLPRLVAAGNVSRIGLAEVVIDDGVPVASSAVGSCWRRTKGGSAASATAASKILE